MTDEARVLAESLARLGPLELARFRALAGIVHMVEHNTCGCTTECSGTHHPHELLSEEEQEFFENQEASWADW